MSKKHIYFPIYLSIAIVVGIALGSTFNFTKKPMLLGGKPSSEEKVKKLINYINYSYVDKVDTDSLLDDAIVTMLSKLDPHSVYMPKEEVERETELMDGKFVGIGVTFMMHQDSVTVTSVIENGPSDKAGLKPGDRIIRAGNDTLFGAALKNKAELSLDRELSFYESRKMSSQVIKTLKGKPYTKVNLAIYRRLEDAVLEKEITRDEVPVKSVTASYKVNEQLGYIKMERFAKTSYIEFKKVLDTFIADSINSLILDLRGNPGGYMEVAVKIIDEFLKEDKLVVFTKNKQGNLDKVYASKRGDFEDGKIYVLIDQNSASASEIVAGALQDNDKGTIVGRRSFGKGLVQREMDLGDGSAVRLTISRYYTPTGRSIQKPYSKNTEYEDDYLERVYNGELMSKDSIKVMDSLKFVTPKGKVVYGGGGIIPDVFVAIDTTTINRNYFRTLSDFSFKYVDNHRSEMNDWELDTFLANFDLEEKIFHEYLKTLDVNMPLSTKSRTILKLYFKAYFAQNLFQETGFYKVINSNDEMVNKVLELEQQPH